MNKVRAWLAVGINEIHPLLIVPSQPKGLAKEQIEVKTERQGHQHSGALGGEVLENRQEQLHNP